MNRFDNPFHDLWVTEILAPNEFVSMFSPIVALQSEELFGTGNVVIKGRQGSGKSMLLSLLNTHTRVAYARQSQDYPAPPRYKSFITAGIHLIRDNTRIVASRLSEIPEESRKNWAATTFADYINYLLVKDLLQNVEYLAGEQAKDGVLKDVLPISWGGQVRELLVKDLKSSPAWYGYLDECLTLDDIKLRVDARLTSYRKYFNFNVDVLDPEVEKTKTDIGEPVAVLADSLRKCGAFNKNTLVFLKIDQHEELYEIEKKSHMARVFRQVINRALAMRDGRVAYRIGTRHYAWSADVAAWGSGADLETMRDYSIVNIDDLLRRRENKSMGVSFDAFAQDVFTRRLLAYGIDLSEDQRKRPLEKVFGKTLSPADRAKIYVKGKPSLLNIPDSWSPEWKVYLGDLWKSDPLQAKLGEIWLRQRKQQREETYLTRLPEENAGWRSKPYWRKERHEAVLVQIAGEAREMLVWSGSRHILDLSGWNILAFMTICRAVWAAWLRSTPDQELALTTLPKIDIDQQVIGVNEASRIWAEKLREGPASNDRYSFIGSIGTWISRSIREDRSLSNPGHTGFSLKKTDFERDNSINELIRVCQDQGDLIGSEHTTKSQDGAPRIKWYLNPLLCPSYRIPHIRTKEPAYLTLQDLEDIWAGRGVKGKLASGEVGSPVQKELF